MEPNRLFVMLDPATDQVLSLCDGPTEEGRCPHADVPPYVCQGLHLVGARGTPEHDISFNVQEMVTGRCPLAWIDEPLTAEVGAELEA